MRNFLNQKRQIILINKRFQTYFPIINTKIYKCIIGGILLYGPRREKTCLQRVANNKGADQPAHPRSLISAFVLLFLERITSELATNKIATF